MGDPSDDLEFYAGWKTFFQISIVVCSILFLAAELPGLRWRDFSMQRPRNDDHEKDAAGDEPKEPLMGNSEGRPEITEEERKRYLANAAQYDAGLDSWPD